MAKGIKSAELYVGRLVSIALNTSRVGFERPKCCCLQAERPAGSAEA